MLATLGTASEGRALSVRSLLDNGSAEFWRHVPLLSGLLGLGIGDTPYTANLRGEKRRDKLLALCVQLLRAKAAQHHTLVLLDNVQWMDAKSWELLLKVGFSYFSGWG
jgi:predicted ATPase